MKAASIFQMLTLRGHTFLPAALGPSSTVIDLGSHKGEFASQVKALFGCRVVAVEANPHLAAQIRVAGLEVHECAIAGFDGKTVFHISANPEASSILAGDGEAVSVSTLTLRSLLARAGVERVDLLKVDIEGAEVAMFDSMSDEDLRRCGQISVEWHDFCGIVAQPDIDRIVNRIRRLGFDDIRFTAARRREDNMNWLFVRRGVRGAGPWRRVFVKHLIQPVRGLIHRSRGGGLLSAN